MKLVSIILLVAAALAFILGIVMRFAGIETFLGQPPLTIWRFVIACIGFAIALILLEMSEKKKE
ncbi:MAG: hypothetical protein AB1410_07805 [Acidobacteriota bacterium]